MDGICPDVSFKKYLVLLPKWRLQNVPTVKENYVLLQVETGRRRPWTVVSLGWFYSSNCAVTFPPLARKPTFQLMFFFLFFLGGWEHTAPAKVAFLSLSSTCHSDARSSAGTGCWVFVCLTDGERLIRLWQLGVGSCRLWRHPGFRGVLLR